MDEGKGDYTSIQHSKADNVGKIPNLSVPGQKGLDATWEKAADLTGKVIEHQKVHPPEENDMPPAYTGNPNDNTTGDSDIDANLFDYYDPAAAGALAFLTQEDAPPPEETKTEQFDKIERTRLTFETLTALYANPQYQDEEAAVEFMKRRIHEIQNVPLWQINRWVKQQEKAGKSTYTLLKEHLEQNINTEIEGKLASAQLAVDKIKGMDKSKDA